MPSVDRLLRIVAVLTLVLMHAPAPTMAQTSETPSDDIVLSRSFFKGMQFSHGSEEEHSVFNFIGSSFTPEFEAVIGQNPEALEAARGSHPWNVVGAIGMLTLTVFMAIDLADAINDAQTLERGSLDINGGGAGLLDYAVVGAVTITANLIARRKLNEGVEIYNSSLSTDGLVDRPGLSHTRTRQWRVTGPGLLPTGRGTAVSVGLQLSR